MDQHEDQMMVDDQTYNDYANATPRPHRHRRALRSTSVDDYDGETSTAKKRDYPEQQNLYDKNGSKRHRSANWPLPSEEPEPSSHSHRHVSSPTRVSKFQEASMNDKPSAKPPSAFTRHFDAHISASVDELMDEYHKTNDKPLPLPPHTGSKTLPRGYGSKSPRRQVRTTSNDNSNSRWSETPPPTESAETEAKTSGIFKFGKSMASAFNPLSVWSKMTGWRAAKEDSAEEVQDVNKLDQKQQAEEAYAKLKQSGKLGSQGTRTISGNATVFTPGYTYPAKDANQRDSGISGMDTDSRTSVDTSQGSFLFPPDTSPRKSHNRTPSFQNLRKMASEFSLHRHSGSRSKSPEKHENDGMRRRHSRGNVFELFNGGGDNIGSVRSNSKASLIDVFDNVDAFGSVRQKKEASKQAKLTRRVSNLESKLNNARRELDKALGTPAPVPVFSPPIAPRPLLSPHNHARQSSNGSRNYTPVLPTLPSESLLVQPDANRGDDGRTLATMDVLHSKDGVHAPLNAGIEDEPLKEGNGNGFYLQHNQPLLKTEFETSPPAKENLPGTPESAQSLIVKLPVAAVQEPKKKTIREEPRSQEPATFLADPSSSPASAALAPTSNSSAKLSPSKKTATKKKRLSQEDKLFRPSKESDNDNDTWDEPKRKTLRKKKRGSDDATDSSKRTRASRLPVTTDGPGRRVKKNVLTKPPPLQKDLPPLPPVDPRSSLEIVHEETTMVPVNSSPTKPTAKATPAFPNHHRTLLSSPYGDPTKRDKTPRPEREARSPSPPPSSSLGKFAPGQRRVSVERVVTAKPNGRDVPPMPGFEEHMARELGKKKSFEWPDDVF